MKITLLGTGASAGVPLIGCKCAVCVSLNPKNRRLRSSILVEDNGMVLLVDSSPDLRQQALAAKLTHIDGVLYTHAHADHTHGIDEIRSFNYLSNKPIPAYADATTLANLKQSFPYAFLPAIPHYGWFRPCLIPHPLEPGHAFKAASMEVLPFLQTHGKITTLGFRFGAMAYSTDVNHLDENAFAVLEGVSLWIIDCLRYTPSPTHADLALTLAWIERVKPKRAILTHMSHDFDYDSLTKSLPEGVEPGYDGMVIEMEAGEPFIA